MVKLVILDRDGVINFDSEEYIKSPEEWIPIPGSIRAISKLTNTGYKIAIATNQSGIARNYFSLEILENIHKKMNLEIERQNGKITNIFFCPHGPDDNCYCRKPKPGLLEQAFDFFKIKEEQKKSVYFVGDSLRDVNAAIQANCTPVLVLTGNGNKTLLENKNYLNNMKVKVFKNLNEFAKEITSLQ